MHDSLAHSVRYACEKYTVGMHIWMNDGTTSRLSIDRAFVIIGDDDDHSKPRNVYGHLAHRPDYAGKTSNSIRISIAS